ncbi:hypothetical protein BCV70DRAFT_8836 [Testicularia cyperi]|uniref:Uncharacterized protein n=1 Tax=Testicularia cyperi TaxID=1882483 RepID=A0A317XXE0_9BASI|nr:hypothetical protein BCV70DRAFT_8836 [Testicularia cyperi]
MEATSSAVQWRARIDRADLKHESELLLVEIWTSVTKFEAMGAEPAVARNTELDSASTAASAAAATAATAATETAVTAVMMVQESAV